MKVTQVTYEKLINTGQFSHERYGITVELEEGEKAEDAFDSAKKVVERQVDCPSEQERTVAETVKKFDDEKDEIPF